MNDKALILTIFCIFFIGIGASYASDISSPNLDNETNNTQIDLYKNNNLCVSSNIDSDKAENNSTNSSSTNKTTTNVKAAGELTHLTQSQILSASKTVSNYITKNKKLPDSVTIAGVNFSMPEYLYLLSMTIYSKYNKVSSAIAIKYNVKNPSKPSGVNINGKLTNAQYYTYSKNIVNYIKNFNTAPNHVNTKLGKMQYQTTIFALNKVVYYSATNNGNLPSTISVSVAKTNTMNKNLPNYVRSQNPSTPNTNSPPNVSNVISLDDIKDAASRVNAFVNQKNELPNTVEINGKKYPMSQFLYLLTSAIGNINSGSTKGITPISVGAPNSPSGSSINGKLTKTQYVSLAKNVTNFLTKNKKAPNFAGSPVGNIKYQTLVWEFSKIIEYVSENISLPSSITINVKSNDPINGGNGGINSDGGSYPTSILNDKYGGESLEQYLKDTKNCPVSNSLIQSLAATITKDCNTDFEKANAIFNWMKKNVDYSFYYNTQKSAIGTYNAKTGNCVDQAHLSVALYRAAGLATRYVHGSCTFTSGSVYGHVWAQVLIGDTWTVSDTTSSRNSLGVVNSWNPNTYTLKTGKVAEISF